MIELKGLYKTYVPNKDTQVHALQDINLTFADSGLVFLLGKSGSGKTTLLNMLGGLDKPTKGEIRVDGKELDLHKEKQINSYRNNQVGFIFQNYGLLEDLTVKSNLKIALDMQHVHAKDERMQKILQTVGLGSCLYRKVSQLSGGQKQRVAIARALIKDSRIILADEPTGNLDERNSKEIFELLQEIAKTRLVIVVTHSQKFAQMYAQRIITLKDGCVAADVMTEEPPQTIAKKPLWTSRAFPFATTLKFAWINIWHVKVRFVLTLACLILSLTFFGAGLSAMRYDKYELFETAFRDNDVTSYTLVSSLYDGDRRSALQPQQLEKIQTDGSLLTYEGIDFSLCYGERNLVLLNRSMHYYPDSIALCDVKKLHALGIDFYAGRAPIKNGEIAITKYFAEGILQAKEFTDYHKISTIDDMIGKKFQFTKPGADYSYRTEITLKIVGILDTQIQYDTLNNLDESLRERYVSAGLHSTLFVSQEMLQKQFFNRITVKANVDAYLGYFMYDPFQGGIVPYHKEHYVASLKPIKQSSYHSDLFPDQITWIDGHSHTLAENEILVQDVKFAYIYNEIKNELILTGEERYDKGALVAKLNEGISCEVTFGEQKRMLKIVGVLKNDNIMVVSDQLELPLQNVAVKSVSATFDPGSVKQTLRSFEENQVTMSGDLYEALQKASTEIEPTAIFGILGFAVFGLFAVMMLASFMTSMIEDNYRQLGILWALGASRGNLVGIYLLVAFLVVFLCNCIAMPMLPIVKQFMQAKEIQAVLPNYVVFRTEWYDYCSMLALSVGITFVGSIVQILTKTRRTPIEMLRGKR